MSNGCSPEILDLPAGFADKVEDNPSSWRNARHLPHGRSRAGDRHLKFYETRDNLQRRRVSDKESRDISDEHPDATHDPPGNHRPGHTG
jgi:hypothetical protein